MVRVSGCLYFMNRVLFTPSCSCGKNNKVDTLVCVPSCAMCHGVVTMQLKWYSQCKVSIALTCVGMTQWYTLMISWKYWTSAWKLQIFSQCKLRLYHHFYIYSLYLLKGSYMMISDTHICMCNLLSLFSIINVDQYELYWSASLNNFSNYKLLNFILIVLKLARMHSYT